LILPPEALARKVGRVVSTNHEAVAELTFPAGSRWLTVKVWLPSVSPDRLREVEHAAAVAPSREHLNVLSVAAVKLILAVFRFVKAEGTPDKTGAVGGVRSMIQLTGVDAALVFPAASICFALNECAPSLRPE
jgi:hypothetical protein